MDTGYTGYDGSIDEREEDFRRAFQEFKPRYNYEDDDADTYLPRDTLGRRVIFMFAKRDRDSAKFIKQDFAMLQMELSTSPMKIDEFDCKLAYSASADYKFTLLRDLKDHCKMLLELQSKFRKIKNREYRFWRRHRSKEIITYLDEFKAMSSMLIFTRSEQINNIMRNDEYNKCRTELIRSQVELEFVIKTLKEASIFNDLRIKTRNSYKLFKNVPSKPESGNIFVRYRPQYIDFDWELVEEYLFNQLKCISELNIEYTNNVFKYIDSLPILNEVNSDSQDENYRKREEIAGNLTNSNRLRVEKLLDEYIDDIEGTHFFRSPKRFSIRKFLGIEF